MNKNIGFMQGRLSPLTNGKIQSFPWETWEQEIELAVSIGIHIMEWTLDQDRLYENPLMTSSGQKKILQLCKKYKFLIPSLTGDCFMQAPFWKAKNKNKQKQLKNDFISILIACECTGIKHMVVPLVDEGSLENIYQEDLLVEFFNKYENKIASTNIKISFESDYEPIELKRFISRLKFENFGVNYDTGNSASLGLDPVEEFHAIGNRIFNVHIKDRIFGGTTVPLGEGDVNFCVVFKLLKAIDYKANYILQTARATDDSHAQVLMSYKSYVEEGIKLSGS